MPTRVRLIIDWTISFGIEGTPFSKVEDFRAYAQAHLERQFKSYNSELTVEVVEDFDAMADLRLVWDVDLDRVAGAWHRPEDHKALAESTLKTQIKSFSHSVKTEIFRFAEANDVDGHAQGAVVPWDASYPSRRYDAFVKEMVAAEAS